jgi:hypothetical protein
MRSPKLELPYAYEAIGTNWPHYHNALSLFNLWIYKKVCNGTTLNERMNHAAEFAQLSAAEKNVIGFIRIDHDRNYA